MKSLTTETEHEIIGPKIEEPEIIETEPQTVEEKIPVVAEE